MSERSAILNVIITFGLDSANALRDCLEATVWIFKQQLRFVVVAEISNTGAEHDRLWAVRA
jgi:hypothetical protein